MPRSGVDKARGDAGLERVVEAGLVARNARVDPLGRPRARLREQERIGQEGSGHRHHVGLPGREDRLGDLWGVDAIGGDERRAHAAAQLLGHPCEASPRHRRRDRGDARLVPADAGVDDVGARRFDGLRERHDLGPFGAAVDEIKHRAAEDDEEVGTCCRPHALHDASRQPDAVLEGPPPLVGPLVGPLCDELVDEIPFGAHNLRALGSHARGATDMNFSSDRARSAEASSEAWDERRGRRAREREGWRSGAAVRVRDVPSDHLDAVVPRLLGESGTARKVVDRALHLRPGQRLWRKPSDGRLLGRRRHVKRMVAVAARVEDLHCDLGALVAVNGLSDEAMA